MGENVCEAYFDQKQEKRRFTLKRNAESVEMAKDRHNMMLPHIIVPFFFYAMFHGW